MMNGYHYKIVIYQLHLREIVFGLLNAKCSKLRKKKCVITYKLGIQGDIMYSSCYDYTLNNAGAEFGLNSKLFDKKTNRIHVH